MGSSKKAFDFKNTSIYVVDPDDLTIIGGASVLVGDELGSRDTEDGPEHPLWDGDRLKEPLTEEEIANTDAFGVIVPIVITKIDGAAVVVAGRTRVRRARVVNARRKARGDAPIAVKAEMRRDDDTGLMGAMIAENEGRRNDEVLAKLAKAKRYIARGVSEEKTAATFNVSLSTLQGWLALEDNATKETKRAIADGRLSPTAAAELARVRDPEKQNVALDRLLTAPGKKTTLAARKAVAGAAPKMAKDGSAKKGDGVGIQSRRLQRAMLDAAVAWDHKGASERSLAWWDGVETVLKALVDGDVDERLAKLIAKAEASS